MKTPRKTSGYGFLLAGISLVGTALVAQDSDRIAPPQALAPAATPIQATPLPPESQSPVPSGPLALPQQPTMMPPVATPVQPAQTPPTPMGATVSQGYADARLIEDVRPERVQVYPEDPQSAWWEINPHYAFDRAQREQKPLMLLFTGIWDARCLALSEEVFSTKSFNEYVKENLVICYLNYPRNITDAHPKLRSIKERFNVRGYPNVLIFNPSGEVERGIRGYRSGRPVDYFRELKFVCQPVLDSIEVRKQELSNRGYRDWSNYLGKMIFAKFMKQDTVRVMLQDVSGQKWIIPINDLAPADQKLVESFPPVPTLAEKQEG